MHPQPASCPRGSNVRGSGEAVMDGGRYGGGIGCLGLASRAGSEGWPRRGEDLAHRILQRGKAKYSSTHGPCFPPVHEANGPFNQMVGVFEKYVHDRGPSMLAVGALDDSMTQRPSTTPHNPQLSPGIKGVKSCGLRAVRAAECVGLRWSERESGGTESGGWPRPAATPVLDPFSYRTVSRYQI